MKSLVLLIVCSLFFAPIYGYDPISESDYLIISHPELEGQWVSELSDILGSRGFRVGF